MTPETTPRLYDGNSSNSPIHLDADLDTNADTDAEADRVEYSSASDSGDEPTDSQKKRLAALRRKWELKIQRYRDEEKATAQQEQMKERYTDRELTEAESLERLRLSLLDGTLRSLDSIARGAESPETERSTDIPVFEDPLFWTNSAASKSADPIPRGFQIKHTTVSADDTTQGRIEPGPFSSFAVTFIGDQSTSATQRLGLSGKDTKTGNTGERIKAESSRATGSR
jgi:hypothetical protein